MEVDYLETKLAIAIISAVYSTVAIGHKASRSFQLYLAALITFKLAFKILSF